MHDFNDSVCLLTGVCCVDQNIYVAGGYDGVSQLSSVERYNVETDQWQMLAPLSIPRSAHSLTFVSNKIYAIGKTTLECTAAFRLISKCSA